MSIYDLSKNPYIQLQFSFKYTTNKSKPPNFFKIKPHKKKTFHLFFKLVPKTLNFWIGPDLITNKSKPPNFSKIKSYFGLSNLLKVSFWSLKFLPKSDQIEIIHDYFQKSIFPISIKIMISVDSLIGL